MKFCINQQYGCNFSCNGSRQLTQHLVNDCEYHCCDYRDQGCSFLGSKFRVDDHSENCNYRRNNNNNDNDENDDIRLNKIENTIEAIYNEIMKPALPPRNEEIEQQQLLQDKIDNLEQQNVILTKKVDDLTNQNNLLDNKLNQVLSLLKINLNLNNNNNNNNPAPSSSSSSSNSEPISLFFDPSNCGSCLSIVEPNKVMSIKKNNINCFVTSKFQFKLNSGIYNWKIKLSNLQNSMWIFFGLGKLENLKLNDNLANRVCYGWTSYGYRCSNNGSLVQCFNTIPPDSKSMIAYLKLDTSENTRELSVKIFDIYETKHYLTDVIKDIPFPCNFMTKLTRKNSQIEILDFQKC
eukprot:TRINITY_DN1959_c0_g8_i1.p1 TRINITY_DN1959_c0_g8~~TRINITY_DN1959_c0_g8_i1.p1  ORF type:complete len:350 (-),score=68.31 TRINITY_DN1959_c0_g8_i1:15-1064(-)